MTQLIVAILIIAANVGMGILAKRQKDLAKKRRAEAMEEALRRQRTNPMSAGGGAATAEADIDEELGEDLFTSRPAPPTAPPPPGTQQPTPPHPTARTTSRRQAPMPARPGPSASEPKRAQGGRPAALPRPTASAQARSAPIVRPQQPTSSQGPDTRQPSRRAPSKRAPSQRGATRKAEHDRRVAERAARKRARQAASRARAARSVTARAVRPATDAAGRPHPVMAALQAVFRNPSTIRTAFVAGEVLGSPASDRRL